MPDAALPYCRDTLLAAASGTEATTVKLRYAISVLAAYGFFFLAVRMWIWYAAGVAVTISLPDLNGVNSVLLTTAASQSAAVLGTWTFSAASPVSSNLFAYRVDRNKQFSE